MQNVVKEGERPTEDNVAYNTHGPNVDLTPILFLIKSFIGTSDVLGRLGQCNGCLEAAGYSTFAPWVGNHDWQRLELKMDARIL